MGLIRIPVPEGHPLREMGVKELVARDAVEERAQRASLNNWTRRSENAELRKQLADIGRKQAFVEATAVAQEKWMQTPEYAGYATRYAEIKEAFGEADANRYWQGIQGDLVKMRDAEFQTRSDAIDQQEMASAADEWVNDARERVQVAIPPSIRELPEFGDWFDRALKTFDAEIVAGEHDDIKPGDTEAMHKKFLAHLTARLARQPAVTAVLNRAKDGDAAAQQTAAAKAAEQQRRDAKIAADAVEAFKRAEAAKRQAVPPHPLGALEPAATARPAPGQPAPEDTSGMSTYEFRRAQRQAARGDAVRHFQAP